MASTAEPVPAPPAEATTTPNPSPPAPSTGSPPATDPEAATKQEAPAVTEAAVPEHEAETAEGGDDAKDWHNGLFGCFGDLGTCVSLLPTFSVDPSSLSKLLRSDTDSDITLIGGVLLLPMHS